MSNGSRIRNCPPSKPLRAVPLRPENNLPSQGAALLHSPFNARFIGAPGVLHAFIPVVFSHYGLCYRSRSSMILCHAALYRPPACGRFGGGKRLARSAVGPGTLHQRVTALRDDVLRITIWRGNSAPEDAFLGSSGVDSAQRSVPIHTSRARRIALIDANALL